MNSNMEYNNEKIAGTIHRAVGVVKEEVGKAIDDPNMANEGTLQKTKGQTQKFSATVYHMIKKGKNLLGIKPKDS
jgi:uncharacterized protein YjbJ (UPF0337 family)